KVVFATSMRSRRTGKELRGDHREGVNKECPSSNSNRCSDRSDSVAQGSPPNKSRSCFRHFTGSVLISVAQQEAAHFTHLCCCIQKTRSFPHGCTSSAGTPFLPWLRPMPCGPFS